MDSTSGQRDKQHTAKPTKPTLKAKRKPNAKASRPSFADNWTDEEHAVWLKKARRKWLGYSVAAHLFFENPDSPLSKSYRNSMHCISQFTPNAEGDKIETKYCKNRWCPVCGAIMTAKLIDAYMPQIKEMKNLRFLTLTLPTCSAEELPEQIKRMTKAFGKITNDKKVRGRFGGIRKSECTFSKGKYHFHFHVLIEGYDNAEHIRREWKKIFPECSLRAQKNVMADERTVKELFKYFTKLTTDSSRKKEKRIMDYKAMDVIFCAMKGKRTIQPFGFVKKPKIEKEEELFEDLHGEIKIDEPFIYAKKETDWVSVWTGIPLTGYRPSANFAELTEAEKVMAYDDHTGHSRYEPKVAERTILPKLCLRIKGATHSDQSEHPPEPPPS